LETETLYTDSLIKIENSAITFLNYSLFSGKEKTIPIDQIENIQVKKPSLWNGRFRISGSGGFGVWFPTDLGRPSRDKIFVAKMKKRWVFHVGFTVENSDAVEDIFKKLGLIKSKREGHQE
jgi:hypothetical protein